MNWDLVFPIALALGVALAGAVQIYRFARRIRRDDIIPGRHLTSRTRFRDPPRPGEHNVSVEPGSLSGPDWTGPGWGGDGSGGDFGGGDGDGGGD